MADPIQDQDQRRYLMPIVFGLGVVVASCCCCGGGGGWWYYETNIKVATKDEDKKKSKPDFVIVDNRAFIEEVVQNEDAARKKYLGKVLEFTGTFIEIRRLGSGRQPDLIVGLEGAFIVECDVRPSEMSKAFRMQGGQKVKLVATYQGQRDRIFVTVDDAVLTELDPKKKLPEFSSETLVADYLRDAKSAEEKYRTDTLITGDIVDFKHNDLLKEITVTMKGSQNTTLNLFYDGDATREGKQLSGAKRATIRTRLVRFEDMKRIFIQAPLVVEAK